MLCTLFTLLEQPFDFILYFLLRYCLKSKLLSNYPETHFEKLHKVLFKKLF